MASDDQLRRLVHEIDGIVTATAARAPLGDSEVRRVLAFVSQVILVVEQAFQDVLTVLVDIQFLGGPGNQQEQLTEIRRRVELLTARSHYRDAAEICSRLKHLRENYDTFIRPSVQKLPGYSEWQGVFGLIEEREGRIIQLVEETAREAARLLDDADAGRFDQARDYAKRRAEELRVMLTDLHSLNGRILGLSGREGFLELTTNRNALEREVRIHVDQRDQSVTHGHRVSVGSGSTFHDAFVVANTIQDSFKQAKEAQSPDLRRNLELLCNQVEELTRDLPEKVAAEVSQDLSTFVAEATKDQPRRKWYHLSADGLIEAAKTCAGMTSPIIATVKGILALLP